MGFKGLSSITRFCCIFSFVLIIICVIYSLCTWSVLFELCYLSNKFKSIPWHHYTSSLCFKMQPWMFARDFLSLLFKLILTWDIIRKSWFFRSERADLRRHCKWALKPIITWRYMLLVIAMWRSYWMYAPFFVIRFSGKAVSRHDWKL